MSNRSIKTAIGKKCIFTKKHFASYIIQINSNMLNP